jgi:hypothetical protein
MEPCWNAGTLERWEAGNQEVEVENPKSIYYY